MRLELAKRDNVWRFRRRRGLAVGKNRHAIVERSHERHCSLDPTPQSQCETGATNCRDRRREIFCVLGHYHPRETRYARYLT